jgi:hypothetical protein
LFFLQDDVKKFVSEPALPPQLVEVLEEGIARTKERHEVGEGDDTVVVEDSPGTKLVRETTQLSLKTHPMRRTTTRRRCRTASSCGRGSAVLAYLTSLSFRINQLA